MTLSLLWTDKCLLFILFICSSWLLWSLRKEDVRRAYTQLFYQPVAVSAGIIILFFVAMGVLDSIRFQTITHANLPETTLDWLFGSLSHLSEETYSKPLSLYQFTSEPVFVDNKMTQIYPRLSYPPLWLTDANKWSLIRSILLTGLVVSVSVVFLLAGLFWRYVKNTWQLPRRVLLTGAFTLAACLFVLITCFWLSHYFHVLGTGKIGQDILYQSVKSIRTALTIGLLTTLFMLPLALFLGVAAGYLGGFIDDVIQYVYTTLSSIPGVLLITASVLSMQTYIANHPERFQSLAASADARLFALCMILGVTSWTSLCRLLRAEALKLREIDFILAAKTLGSSTWQIMIKHLLPNVMHIVLITLVLDFSYLVLAESVLSYVGVGVSPLTISWGNMINAARLELAREPVVWWPVISAFLFMFTLVLASNLFADALRDAFDPHRR